MKITVECPTCKQISETTFRKAFRINADFNSAAWGNSIDAYVSSVYYVCSGCKAVTEVEYGEA